MDARALLRAEGWGCAEALAHLLVSKGTLDGMSQQRPVYLPAGLRKWHEHVRVHGHAHGHMSVGVCMIMRMNMRMGMRMNMCMCMVMGMLMSMLMCVCMSMKHVRENVQAFECVGHTWALDSSRASDGPIPRRAIANARRRLKIVVRAAAIWS